MEINLGPRWMWYGLAALVIVGFLTVVSLLAYFIYYVAALVINVW